MKPLFIFSMPRAGSTLLQRVLAADKQISSVAEPWVLLPFIYALKEQGVRAEYSHHWAHVALMEFIQELPNGRQDYLSAVGLTMRELYRRASKNKDARYFLDKTPRYALIADEIIDTFPEGKFIFLWRNPLAIIASIVETWGNGEWDLSMSKVDLFDGMVNLIEDYQARHEKILAVQYENFLQSPEKELYRIAEYLELEFDPDVLKNFSQVSFSGKLGDSTGVRDYKAVDTAPLEKWKTVINNPLRKRWCRRYLRWLGEERLKVMGYDLSVLLRELDSTGTSLNNLFTDIFRLLNPRVKPELPCKLHM
ncbi:MAG: sulfotransferase [Gallionella sp.]